MIQALKITGPFNGWTGYDKLVRRLVRELLDRNIKIQLVDMPDWSPSKLPQDMRDPQLNALTHAIPGNLHLHICMPHQVIASPDMKNVNYTMFESSRISQGWAEQARKLEATILPTESSRQAWINAGVPAAKLALCPQGVDEKQFHPDATPLALTTASGRCVDSYSHRFLTVADVSERKNLPGLLRTWIQATTQDTDAILMLRFGFGLPHTGALYQQVLDDACTQTRKTPSEAAPILFLNEPVAENDLAGLYTAATHYWTMSFGEGWNMPLTEAAMCGLQLIAPRHTAHESYLTAETVHWIQADPVDAGYEQDAATHDLFAGSHWWKPNESEAEKTLRQIIADSTQRKKSAREALLKYSWANAAKELLQVLDEI
jgi:glycosyltransferase involved in cell wall biosynthesis